MLAPVVMLSWGARAALPRWLGVVGGIALTEQTIETVTIFGRTGFTAPGGPMNLVLGAGLVSIWWLCLGIRLARGSSPRPTVSAHRGTARGDDLTARWPGKRFEAVGAGPLPASVATKPAGERGHHACPRAW